MIPLALTIHPPSANELVAMGLVIFFAIGIHEYAHAKFADMAGDPTPGMYGRVTLNLFKHFELFGTLFIIITMISGFGIGWGRPVPMNPGKMRNPKWDHFWAVLAGPASNLIQALIFAVVFHLTMTIAPGLLGAEFVRLFVAYGILINVGLFFFNLIPLGPLDGMWLVGTFLPDAPRLSWTRFNLSFGSFLFIGLILFSQISGGGLLRLLFIPVAIVVQLLVGEGGMRALRG